MLDAIWEKTGLYRMLFKLVKPRSTSFHLQQGFIVMSLGEEKLSPNQFTFRLLQGKLNLEQVTPVVLSNSLYQYLGLFLYYTIFRPHPSRCPYEAPNLCQSLLRIFVKFEAQVYRSSCLTWIKFDASTWHLPPLHFIAIHHNLHSLRIIFVDWTQILLIIWYKLHVMLWYPLLDSWNFTHYDVIWHHKWTH